MLQAVTDGFWGFWAPQAKGSVFYSVGAQFYDVGTERKKEKGL